MSEGRPFKNFEPMETYSVDDPVHMPKLWSEALNISRSEARRVIAQGGQRLDGVPDRSMDILRADLDGKVVNLATAAELQFVEDALDKTS